MNNRSKSVNENMMRKHNWQQLQIIQNKIDKQGGDISKEMDKQYKDQENTANSYWINNPLNKDIQLSDNQENVNTHTDPQLENLPKNSLIKKYEHFSKNTKNEKLNHKIYLNGSSKKNENKDATPDENSGNDRGNVNTIHRNMKNIQNWNNSYQKNVQGIPHPERERNILRGRQVKYNNDKTGFVEQIEDDGVRIQTGDEEGNKILKFSEIFKNNKEKNF